MAFNDVCNTRVILRPEWNLHLGHLGSVFFNHKIVEDFYKKHNISNKIQPEKLENYNKIIHNVWGNQTNNETEKQTKNIGKFYIFVNDFNIQKSVLYRFYRDLRWLKLQYLEIISLNNQIGVIDKYLSNLIHNNKVILELGNHTYIYDQNYINAIYKDNGNNLNIIYPIKFRLNLPEAKYPLITMTKYPLSEQIYSINFLIAIFDIEYNITNLVDSIYKHQITLEVEIMYKWLFKYFKKEIPHKIYHNGYKIANFYYKHNDILDLINKRIIQNYSDPRLLTVAGMRNKGIPVNVIKEFCNLGNKRLEIQLQYLDYILELYLQTCSISRLNVICNPITIVLTNFRKKETEYLLTSKRELISLSHMIYISKEHMKYLKLDTEIYLQYGLKIKPEKFLKNDIIEARYLGNYSNSNFFNGNKIKIPPGLNINSIIIPWLSPDLELNSGQSNLIMGKINLYNNWYISPNINFDYNCKTIYCLLNKRDIDLTNSKNIENIYLIEGLIDNYTNKVNGYFSLQLQPQLSLESQNKLDLVFNLIRNVNSTRTIAS